MQTFNDDKCVIWAILTPKLKIEKHAKRLQITSHMRIKCY